MPLIATQILGAFAGLGVTGWLAWENAAAHPDGRGWLMIFAMFLTPGILLLLGFSTVAVQAVQERVDVPRIIAFPAFGAIMPFGLFTVFQLCWLEFTPLQTLHFVANDPWALVPGAIACSFMLLAAPTRAPKEPPPLPWRHAR